MLGWVLVPARLAKRAFDDVHDIAEAVAALPSEVVKLRIAVEGINPRVEDLRDAFDGSNEQVGRVGDKLDPLSDKVDSMVEELGDVRDVVEPLQPAAERIGKLAERLPGSGRSGRRHQRG